MMVSVDMQGRVRRLNRCERENGGSAVVGSRVVGGRRAGIGRIRSRIAEPVIGRRTAEGCKGGVVGCHRRQTLVAVCTLLFDLPMLTMCSHLRLSLSMAAAASETHKRSSHRTGGHEDQKAKGRCTHGLV